MQGIRNISDRNFARDGRWEASIDFPGIDFSDIPYVCEVTSIPGWSVNEESIYFRGVKGSQPGQETSTKEISITFKDKNNFDLWGKLFEMKQMMADADTGESSVSMEALKNGTISLAMKDAAGLIRLRLNMAGAWCKEVPNVNLSQEGTSILKFTATFAYDTMKPSGWQKTGNLIKLGSLSAQF